MIRDITLTDIQPDPNQPRYFFDEEKLLELAESIKENGLVSPILLRETSKGLMIVHGERRYRACKLLGLETIRAEVKELTEEQARRIALVENVQRADLSPIEEARAYQQMLETMTQAELGKVVGKSQSHIAHKLRLLKLSKPLAYFLETGVLDEGHVRVLMTLKAFYHDATETFFTDVFTDFNIEAISHDDCVWFAAQIRPEAYVLLLNSEKPFFDVAVKQFLRYVQQEKTTPIFERAAFWWGLWAVCADASVVNLNQAITGFKERALSNLVFQESFRYTLASNASNKASNRVDQVHSQQCRADLKHGGLLGNVPDKLMLDAIDYVFKSGGYSYPSNIQFFEPVRDAIADDIRIMREEESLAEIDDYDS
jgi:ParB/RepB/Spo0J family partition protein